MLSSKTWISIALGPNWPNNPYHILPWWPFGCGRLLKAIDRGDPLNWADMLCALGLPCRIAFVCLTARPTTVLEQREILRLDHQLWPHEWDNYMTITIWLIYVSICTYIYINVYYSFFKTYLSIYTFRASSRSVFQSLDFFKASLMHLRSHLNLTPPNRTCLKNLNIAVISYCFIKITITLPIWGYILHFETGKSPFFGPIPVYPIVPLKMGAYCNIYSHPRVDRLVGMSKKTH